MKRLILILALAFNSAHCGKTNTKTTEVSPKDTQRQLASVEDSATNNIKKSPLGEYPRSFISFLKNETQRVKLESTLKQYSQIIPEATYTKMLNISKKVDDSGFSIKRNNSNLILDNGKSKFIVGFSGNLNTILTTIQGQTYNFNNQKDLDTYLASLESKIDKDTKNQKPSSAEPKNGANLFYRNLNILNTAHLAKSFFLQCQLLSLPFMAQDSEAIATGWFIIGGMALIAVAIAVAANKMTKNLKKTEHTVNVNHKVGLSQSSEDVIKDLSDSVKEIDVDLLSNNNVNVDSSGVSTSKSSLGIE
jgi:hypothetical protein